MRNPVGRKAARAFFSLAGQGAARARGALCVRRPCVFPSRDADRPLLRRIPSSFRPLAPSRENDFRATRLRRPRSRKRDSGHEGRIDSGADAILNLITKNSDVILTFLDRLHARAAPVLGLKAGPPRTHQPIRNEHDHPAEHPEHLNAVNQTLAELKASGNYAALEKSGSAGAIPRTARSKRTLSRQRLNVEHRAEIRSKARAWKQSPVDRRGRPGFCRPSERERERGSGAFLSLTSSRRLRPFPFRPHQ